MSLMDQVARLEKRVATLRNALERVVTFDHEFCTTPEDLRDIARTALEKGEANATDILATVREDDDERLTEEFVERCNPPPGTDDGLYFYWDANVPMNNPRPGLLGLLSYGTNGCHEFAHIKTRGEFRALCRLLGVTLKEDV